MGWIKSIKRKAPLTWEDKRGFNKAEVLVMVLMWSQRVDCNRVSMVDANRWVAGREAEEFRTSETTILVSASAPN